MTSPTRFALACLALAAAFAASGCRDTNPVYAPCGGSDDCKGAADGCYRILLTRSDGTEGDGKLCTVECSADADCPDDGACLALEGDADRSFLCYERCAEPADCYQGFRCTTVESPDGSDRVCLP